jgi:hypothetical protein
MAVLLFLLALVAGFLGMSGLVLSKGAIQEAVAMCFLIMSAVFFAGSCIVAAIGSAAKDIIAKLEERPLPAPTARTPGAEPVLKDIVS